MLKAKKANEQKSESDGGKRAKLSYSLICKRCDKPMVTIDVSQDAHTFECKICGRVDTETALQLQLGW